MARVREVHGSKLTRPKDQWNGHARGAAARGANAQQMNMAVNALAAIMRPAKAAFRPQRMSQRGA